LAKGLASAWCKVTALTAEIFVMKLSLLRSFTGEFMSFNCKSNYCLSGSIATTVVLSLAFGGLMAQSAQAQVVTGPVLPPGNSYSDCTTATICSNGAGSTLAEILFSGSVTNTGAIVTPGVFNTAFPGLFNYSSRGTGTGISSFISQTPPIQSLPNSPSVPRPFSFASTDAPLTQSQLDQYFAARQDGPLGGFGAPVELPFAASSIAVLYNDGNGITAPTEAQTIALTRQDECTVFNGGTATVANPQGGNVTLNQGARRLDSSGTTFITTNHLNTVCTPLGLWSYANSAGAQVSRGFGQTSLADNSAACQAATAALANTVCWPSAFLTGSGDGGLAAAVDAGAAGTFGYVGFATAAALDNGTVDIDLSTATNGGSVRGFAFTDIARVQNPSAAGAPFVSPVSGNISVSLLATPDSSPAACRVVFNEPDPADGYPIIGVSYYLFYGDYTPNNQGTFNGRGGTLRDRYRSLVQQTLTFSNVAALGYAPLPASAQSTVVAAAFRCINNLASAPTIDVAPGGAGRIAP
jgi:ABC-type phosphate transport system substrate-binding protein